MSIDSTKFRVGTDYPRTHATGEGRGGERAPYGSVRPNIGVKGPHRSERSPKS